MKEGDKDIVGDVDKDEFGGGEFEKQEGQLFE